MKSLAERQADRIQRKANNKELSTAGTIGNDIGAAAVAYDAFIDAAAKLSDEGRDELKALISEGGDPFKSQAEIYGDAFDEDGNLKTAGVGVVNPLIAPTNTQLEVESKAGVQGWGDLVGTSNVDTSGGGNEAGIAGGDTMKGDANTGGGDAATGEETSETSTDATDTSTSAFPAPASRGRKPAGS